METYLRCLEHSKLPNSKNQQTLIKQKNKLTLISDNPTYHPYTVNADEVLEMWQAQVVISRTSSQNRWDMAQLATVVSDLQQQVSTLKKKMN